MRLDLNEWTDRSRNKEAAGAWKVTKNRLTTKMSKSCKDVAGERPYRQREINTLG